MNTQYVLSLSYGKDSLACLEACRLLGYRIDRIIHAEVWATDTIPADLPPMVEFKKKADEIIKARYGLTVEHICATRRAGESHTRVCSIEHSPKDDLSAQSTVSPVPAAQGLGVENSSTDIKLTYEDIFYRPVKRKSREREREQFTAFPSSEGIGVRATSSNRLCDSVESILHRGTQETSPYGFPISVRQGNWCTKLKQRVFRQHPRTRCGYKYCAISWHCGR